MDVFFELHSGLPREAPGSDAATTRALSQIPSLSPKPHILDIGCGPGMQTITLARRTGGHVTAVDTHQPYLDELHRRAMAAGLDGRITPCDASMDALPFEPASFDLLWAEGSIYIMGFREGLLAWRPLLKPGGALALTELTWLVPDPPDEARRFWLEAYPNMKQQDENIDILMQAGYTYLDSFALQEKDWFEAYYTPLERRLEDLRAVYRGDVQALEVLNQERKEIDLYRKYGTAYGYVFYIMQK